MEYHTYFNFVCECVDKAAQLIKDGKDKGLVLGKVVEGLCSAEGKAHDLRLVYSALQRADREDWKKVLKESLTSTLMSLLLSKGGSTLYSALSVRQWNR